MGDVAPLEEEEEKKKKKVEVKFTLEQAMKDQRRSRGIALLFNLGSRWRWVVNVTLRPLYLRKRDPVPIV